MNTISRRDWLLADDQSWLYAGAYGARHIATTIEG